MVFVVLILSSALFVFSNTTNELRYPIGLLYTYIYIYMRTKLLQMLILKIFIVLCLSDYKEMFKQN